MMKKWKWLCLVAGVMFFMASPAMADKSEGLMLPMEMAIGIDQARIVWSVAGVDETYTLTTSEPEITIPTSSKEGLLFLDVRTTKGWTRNIATLQKESWGWRQLEVMVMYFEKGTFVLQGMADDKGTIHHFLEIIPEKDQVRVKFYPLPAPKQKE